MPVEKAESQTMEAKDGYPIENKKFCGGAQEIMAIIQGNKPVASTHFDNDYKYLGFYGTFIKNKQEKEFYHKCHEYSYEDVYNASKKVKLLRYKYDEYYNKILKRKEKAYYYFLEENIKEAYLLSTLWGKDFMKLVSKYNILEDETHIIIGLLLGYQKKDIRAFFLMELSDVFHMDFNNLDQRAAFIKKPAFQKRRDEIAAQFEKNYKTAQEKLKQIMENTVVPKEWIAKCTTLPPPKKNNTRKQAKKSKGTRKH